MALRTAPGVRYVWLLPLRAPTVVTTGALGSVILMIVQPGDDC